MSETLTAKQERPIAGATSTGWLKLIALVFMLIDHAGKMLFNNALWMRTLGRIAFPLYCWCVVVGICHTRSVPKYLLRMLIVGVISQPLYMLALDHTWTDPNIFLTLALGLCALWGIREKKWLSHIWAPVAAMVLSVVLNANYGWRGIFLIILLYAVRDSKAGIAAVMAAFCLYWGSSSSLLSSFLGLPVAPLMKNTLTNTLLMPWMHLQTMAILSLPLMLVNIPKAPKLPHWLGYGIYPAHLLLLWALEQMM